MKKMGLLLLLMSYSLGYSQAIPDDTTSVDKMISALYDVISGPAGQRDWGRMKNLFTKDAQMGAVFKNQEGIMTYRSFSPDDYIKNNDPYFLKNAFIEKELHRTTQTFGPLVQVFTTYEFESGNEKARGINSLQLIFTNQRWYIASIIWTEETPDNPIPKAYLPK
jgi:hypothetical protein